MEIDFEALTQIFLTESETMLNTMEQAVMVLETQPDDEETLFLVFRTAHTLKGSAGCLGLPGIPEFAHIVEDVLQRMHSQTVAVTPELITLLLRAVDALRQMAAVAGGDGITDEYQALLDQLARAAEAASSNSPPAAKTTFPTPAPPAAPVDEPAALEPYPAALVISPAPAVKGDDANAINITKSQPVEPAPVPAAKANAAATVNETVGEGSQYLTFYMGEEEYGIPILNVREILEYDTLTRVPATPPWIRGVINLRGYAIPVVDLAVKFGLAESQIGQWTCIITVETIFNGVPVAMGVMADRVSQVMELQAKDVVMPPAFGTRLRADYLLGMGRVEKRFVLLLNIDQVLSTDELLTVAMAGEAMQEQEAVA